MATMQIVFNNVEFMGYFESVMLKNRHHIDTGMLNHANSLLGRGPVSGGCSSCLKNAALDLLNVYNSNLQAYEQYKLDKAMEAAAVSAQKKDDEIATKAKKKNV